MSTIHINSSSRSAIVSNCSEGVFFDDFFSQNAIGRNGTNNYIQDVYNDFSACSFTGKERDEETGYGYFGARYMDHELMTMWLSVDPMADKYLSISPYAYCAWNPVKLVDPDGRDVEIIKDDENKTVIVRANFYYDPKIMGKQSSFFMGKFKDALDAWGNDMQAALDGDPSLGASGFTVLFEYNCIESENPENDAKNDKAGIGNWISNDPDLPSATKAKVVNNKNLRVDFSVNRGGENGYYEDFYNSHNGTLKHEIGHIFGLRDRYSEAKDHAPYIPNDLMTRDNSRGNAVEPFKRVWRTAGFHTGTTRAQVNHLNNRERRE